MSVYRPIEFGGRGILKLYISNISKDTIQLSYYPNTMAKARWLPSENDSCFLDGSGISNPPCLFDSSWLIRRNGNVHIFNNISGSLSIILPPNNPPVCVGFDYLGVDGGLMVLGDARVKTKLGELNFIEILNAKKFKRGRQSLIFTVDSSFNQLFGYNSKTYFQQKKLSRFSDHYELIGEDKLVVTTKQRKKILWVEYFSIGQIDSVYSYGKMLTRCFDQSNQ